MRTKLKGNYYCEFSNQRGESKTILNDKSLSDIIDIENDHYVETEHKFDGTCGNKMIITLVLCNENNDRENLDITHHVFNVDKRQNFTLHDIINYRNIKLKCHKTLKMEYFDFDTSDQVTVNILVDAIKNREIHGLV